MSRSSLVLVAACAAIVSGNALADVVEPQTSTLQAARDNSIWEESGALSNGAGAHLFAGNTSFDTARRALLTFDLGSVPTGPVLEVQLSLQCSMSPPSAAPATFTLHRVTADWGQGASDAGNPGGLGAPAEPGDATWTERFFGQGMAWSVDGGDFVAAPSATVTVGVCPAAVEIGSTPQLVLDVFGWLQDPATNFGWILIGDEAALTTARRFVSREGKLVDRPLLTVLSSVPPDPTPATGAWGSLVLAVGLALSATLALLRRPRATC